MSMTKEEKSFFDMLSEFPRIAVYWDKVKKELNINALEQDLDSMSSGESAIARWLAGVWFHENRFNFDIFQHMPNFQDMGLKTFQKWVNAPFYP